jgi:mannosyl-oligosaccharide glucosidase
MYSDYGNHTYNVKLVINRDYNPPVKMRKVINEPSLKFVDSFGYVNLFPFLVKLLPPDSVQLESVLNQISNESLLWTKYGLRSLARNDPFYNKANTGQDKPYWRGAIWININYMCLGALRYYGNEDGPHQARSKELYEQLRNNIIINMYEEYQRTGYIWEQYDDRNGQGKGTHPFTGWSSLVLLMMAEIY